MDSKIYITWDELTNDTKTLCDKITATGSFNKIIAVSRGGLVPAGLLSYMLGIRDVETINISSYDEDKQRDDSKIEISPNNQISKADSKTLIVDDLSDTGRTFNVLRQLYPNSVLVSVYAKEKGKDAVNIFARSMPNNWVVFPWD